MTYRNLRVVCLLHCWSCGVSRLRFTERRALAACYRHDDSCLHQSVELLAGAVERLDRRVRGEAL